MRIFSNNYNSVTTKEQNIWHGRSLLEREITRELYGEVEGKRGAGKRRILKGFGFLRKQKKKKKTETTV